MTGTDVLHYRIGERLGAGGMGEVYRAEDTRLGREVAIKFLPSSYKYDPGRRERFMREARAASVLRSPHVAAIFDIGESSDALFIVMELVEGELLSRKVARGPLKMLEAIDMASQVADALDEAGTRGIVHRDIKSANIAVTPRGLVKVLDFGLAKVITRADGVELAPTIVLPALETTPGAVLGTVSYMSPEQALGRPVDPRSDIFSLGVVLFEMLTGRLPFEGSSPTEVIDRIVNREPPALARLNYEVTPEVEQIVRKAMAKDADYRYQTARELFIDLHEVRRLLGDPDHTQTMVLVPVHGRSTSKSPTGTTSSLRAARMAPSVAVVTFANITKEPTDAWIGAGIAETVTADLKKVSGLSVIGREHVFDALKAISETGVNESDERYAIEVGRRLGAAWIVAGGYQRVGEQIRITARFLDVASGALLKSVKIDGTVAEIFDLQDKIVYELTEGLNLELGQSEIVEIERDETQSVEAYECYSRGIMNLRSASRESLDRAIFLLRKATEYDPDYASAWAALGAAYDLKASFLSIKELALTAVECELRALALNPGSARAHEWLGGAYITLGRYDEAIAAVRRALEIEPTSTGARQTLARALWIGKGRIDEAIVELERVSLHNPQLGYAFLQLALLYTFKGEYAKAEAVCRKAIELQERHISGKVGLLIVGARTRLGYVYYCQGRYEEALREYELELDFLATTDHALRERHMIELYQKLGAAKLRLGDAVAAEDYFQKAIAAYGDRLGSGSDDPHTKYYMACVYALRGDAERAVRCLRESMEYLRDLDVVRARIDPDFDAIRDDERFAALVRLGESAGA